MAGKRSGVSRKHRLPCEVAQEGRIAIDIVQSVAYLRRAVFGWRCEQRLAPHHRNGVGAGDRCQG